MTRIPSVAISWASDCAHDRQGGLGYPQRAEQVGLELLSNVVLTQLLHHAEVSVAGAIDNNVESAEVSGGASYGFPIALAVGDIELDR